MSTCLFSGTLFNKVTNVHVINMPCKCGLTMVSSGHSLLPGSTTLQLYPCSKLSRITVNVKIFGQITIRPISIRETNCAIHGIEIYPVDSVIHLLNNSAQVSQCHLKAWLSTCNDFQQRALLAVCLPVNLVSLNVLMVFKT